MEKPKHLGLHIDLDLHYKLKYVADYDGRSISGEIMYLIRRYISAFEKEQGKIEMPQEKQQAGE